MKGWHFLPNDRRMQFDERELVEAGKTYKVDPPIYLCSWGLHASDKSIDALGYAPGFIVCRVELGGEIIRDNDKAVATERTVLWMADAERTLHEFAIWCADRALTKANVKDERCWNALKVKQLWLEGGKATDKERAAARDAARDAARAAAWDAAWAAARDAARAAARDAAWAAQEKQLVKMLKAGRPCTES
jgi:hypothetical protein